MRAGGALMERAGRRGGNGALRWSWDYPRSTLGNTTEVVTRNLLTAMGNTRLGEIWSHKRLTQVIRCLKVSLFSPRNQIASLPKMEQLGMLQAGGEARNTFTLPWHASVPSASRLVHPLCSVQPAVPEVEAVLNFPPPAGTGKQIKAYPRRSALCPCGAGAGSGIGAASSRAEARRRWCSAPRQQFPFSLVSPRALYFLAPCIHDILICRQSNKIEK